MIAHTVYNTRTLACGPLRTVRKCIMKMYTFKEGQKKDGDIIFKIAQGISLKDLYVII